MKKEVMYYFWVATGNIEISEKPIHLALGSGGGVEADRGAGGSPLLLEAQLAGAVLRAEEAQRHLEEREMDLRLTTEHAMDLQGQRDQLQGKRDQLQGQRDQL
ncbi:hypothetical protein Taro_039498 [Colocasia esculenta]|uniref:Uncharacterized protein n=1 Tax=Colocasia esculenta TaxID=4460 RepID=A0A843WQD0_COLES|nr:hypothetical protein [Colocasia esculenta]